LGVAIAPSGECKAVLELEQSCGQPVSFPAVIAAVDVAIVTEQASGTKLILREATPMFTGQSKAALSSLSVYHSK
jgi:hypothetical protein